MSKFGRKNYEIIGRTSEHGKHNSEVKIQWEIRSRMSEAEFSVTEVRIKNSEDVNSKTGLKRPLKNRQNKDLNDK